MGVEATLLAYGISLAIGWAAEFKGQNKADIAAAVGLNVEELKNEAIVGEGSTVESAGPEAGITVSAVTPGGLSNIFLVWGLAGAGGQSKADVAASIAVQVIGYDDTATVGAGSKLVSKGGVEVSATDPLVIQDLALAGGLSIGGSAVGGSIAVNVLEADVTLAAIESSASKPTVVQAAGKVAVRATTSLLPMAPDITDLKFEGERLPGGAEGIVPPLSSIAIGAAASSEKVAVTGSFVIDVDTFRTEALIGEAAQVSQGESAAGIDRSVRGQRNAVCQRRGRACGRDRQCGRRRRGDRRRDQQDGRRLDRRFGEAQEQRRRDDRRRIKRALFRARGRARGLERSGRGGLGGRARHQPVGWRRDLRRGRQVGERDLGRRREGARVRHGQRTGPVRRTGERRLQGGRRRLLRHARAPQTVEAGVGEGASIAGRGAEGVHVSATQEESIKLIAVGGSVGGNAGVAGSATVDVLTDTTNAHIDPGAKVNCAGVSCTDEGAAASQEVAVVASDKTTTFDTAGVLAIGGDAGIGAGVDVQVLNKNTTASSAPVTPSTPTGTSPTPRHRARACSRSPPVRALVETWR